MKVAVIGAGIVGVTTAYELSTQGHEVHVYERSGSAAEVCSFANAGVSSPGYVTPWAKPGMASHVLLHLWQKHTPVRLHRPKLHELRWLWLGGALATKKPSQPTVRICSTCRNTV